MAKAKRRPYTRRASGEHRTHKVHVYFTKDELASVLDAISRSEHPSDALSVFARELILAGLPKAELVAAQCGCTMRGEKIETPFCERHRAAVRDSAPFVVAPAPSGKASYRERAISEEDFNRRRHAR